MLLSSSDTRGTLMHLFLLTNTGCYGKASPQKSLTTEMPQKNVFSQPKIKKPYSNEFYSHGRNARPHSLS